jgi:hypothetical protein
MFACAPAIAPYPELLESPTGMSACYTWRDAAHASYNSKTCSCTAASYMWQLHMCILFNQEMITGHWALVLRMSILSGCRMLSPVTGTSRPRWSMSNGHRTDVGTSGHVSDLPEGRSICAYKPSGQPQIAACKTPNTHSHPTALFNQYLILFAS